VTNDKREGKFMIGSYSTRLELIFAAQLKGLRLGILSKRFKDSEEGNGRGGGGGWMCGMLNKTRDASYTGHPGFTL
jgi:hypothetical protein